MQELSPNTSHLESSNSEIQLTEAEVIEALTKAKEEKAVRLRRQLYSDKINAIKLIPAYTASQLLDKIKMKGLDEIRGFEVDEFNEQQLIDLSHYFTGDKRFETNDRSLGKGLLLMGSIGCGKTSIMRLFSNNQIASYMVISCRTVSADFANYGDEGVEKYKYAMSSAFHGRDFDHHKSLGICFDDLGTEENKKHYGNSSNVMCEIILNRYDQKEALRNKTHITTNLTAEDIKSMYGDRFVSRARELFNVIEFDKKIDRRK